jgi:hypothetical protein
MIDKPATYWHMLPAYSQDRKAIWTAVNPHTGKRRIDEAFPHELRGNTNEQGMFIRLKNGATWQVLGSDRYGEPERLPPQCRSPLADGHGRGEPVAPERRQEDERAPFAERRLGDQAHASAASAMGARHIGFGPDFIDEDEPGEIDRRLTRLPTLTPKGDVRSILFGRAQALWNGPPLLPAMYARRHFQEEEWE